MRRPFQLDEQSVQLPRGTRVVLKTEIEGEDGFRHRPATVAIVRDVAYSTYALETPSGRRLEAQRDQIVIQRPELLEDLGQRQWDFRKLESEVIYSATVGSVAWGLANESSDQDVRGVFIAPFEDHASLWRCPDEIQSPTQDAAYWEVEKLLIQGLRGDANTLETLWSPHHRTVTPLGQILIDRREMFVSMNVLGSFGRYAQSQFEKIQRSLERDALLSHLLEVVEAGRTTDVDGATSILLNEGLARDRSATRKEVLAVCRSLFDRGLVETSAFDGLMRALASGRKEELRPKPHRPKNAYNLLRLLHSCLHWLEHGAPLIEVTGPLRETLLAIKAQRTPIEETLAAARALTTRIDEAAQGSQLPESPDHRAADEFLRLCRRDAARRSLTMAAVVSEAPAGTFVPGPLAADDPWLPSVLPDALPPDVDPDALRRFFSRYLGPEAPSRLRLSWVALTGAHAYGFVSPDSDLDLKAVHVAPANELLGLDPAPTSVDFLGDFEAREYDFTSNEIGGSIELIVKGNGNLLERFLGPFTIISTPAGHQLRELVKASLSRRSYYHYRGFFTGMRREYELQKREGKGTAKRLLYAYRVALTGICLLLEGEIETNVRRLAQRYRYPRVPELIAIKAQAEKVGLGDGDDAPYLEDLERLEPELDAAFEKSLLPETPPNRDAFDRLLVAQRIAATQGGT